MDWSAKTAAAIILGIGRQLFDSVKCTRRKLSWIMQSERPQQAGWMGQQDLHEVQQTHIPCGRNSHVCQDRQGTAGWVRQVCSKGPGDRLDKLTVNQQYDCAAREPTAECCVSRASSASGWKLHEHRLRELWSFCLDKRGRKGNLVTSSPISRGAVEKMELNSSHILIIKKTGNKQKLQAWKVPLDTRKKWGPDQVAHGQGPEQTDLALELALL